MPIMKRMAAAGVYLFFRRPRSSEMTATIPATRMAVVSPVAMVPIRSCTSMPIAPGSLLPMVFTPAD